MSVSLTGAYDSASGTSFVTLDGSTTDKRIQRRRVLSIIVAGILVAGAAGGTALIVYEDSKRAPSGLSATIHLNPGDSRLLSLGHSDGSQSVFSAVRDVVGLPSFVYAIQDLPQGIESSDGSVDDDVGYLLDVVTTSFQFDIQSGLLLMNRAVHNGVTLTFSWEWGNRTTTPSLLRVGIASPNNTFNFLSRVYNFTTLPAFAFAHVPASNSSNGTLEQFEHSLSAGNRSGVVFEVSDVLGNSLENAETAVLVRKTTGAPNDTTVSVLSAVSLGQGRSFVALPIAAVADETTAPSASWGAALRDSSTRHVQAVCHHVSGIAFVLRSVLCSDAKALMPTLVGNSTEDSTWRAAYYAVLASCARIRSSWDRACRERVIRIHLTPAVLSSELVEVAHDAAHSGKDYSAPSTDYEGEDWLEAVVANARAVDSFSTTAASNTSVPARIGMDVKLEARAFATVPGFEPVYNTEPQLVQSTAKQEDRAVQIVSSRVFYRCNELSAADERHVAQPVDLSSAMGEFLFQYDMPKGAGRIDIFQFGAAKSQRLLFTTGCVETSAWEKKTVPLTPSASNTVLLSLTPNCDGHSPNLTGSRSARVRPTVLVSTTCGATRQTVAATRQPHAYVRFAEAGLTGASAA